LKKGQDPAVVNISSVLGKRGLPGRCEYSASKFAVQGFSEALRAELARFGIDVIVINPGLTATNFSQNMLERKSKLQVDHLRGMTAEQVAAATLRAVERGAHEVNFTGRGKLLVFVNRFFPRLVDRIAARRVRKLYAGEPLAE
jgi:short-subunit dehydrogenase